MIKYFLRDRRFKLLATLILTILTYLALRYLSIYVLDNFGHRHEASLAVVVREIKQGDSRFKNRLYDAALGHYREAAKLLDDLVQFEKKSPQADIDALQHYYNIQVILETKRRIAEIGLEASGL